MSDNYKEDVKIDKYDLHNQLAETPSLYMDWAEKYSKIKAVLFKEQEKLKLLRVECKSEFDRFRAELDLLIRNDWAKHGQVEKMTESSINSTLITRKELIEKEKELNTRIQKQVDEVAKVTERESVFEGAKVAMNIKKACLGDEVSLWLGGYYSEVKVPQEMHKQIKQANDVKITKKLKKRVRE